MTSIFKKELPIIAKILTAFILFGWSLSVQAADLKVVTDHKTYRVGDIVTARILLSSADRSANALSGVLSFPTDKLQVVSLSKVGSIINMWVKDPNFSNLTGQVSFEGVILNPGFTGSAGQVILVNLKAKKTGTAMLTFAAGSILANDGQGTSILGGLGQASFTIGQAVEAPVPAVAAKTPALPVINSPTHPDQTKWFNNQYPEFTWKFTNDITSINFSLDDKKGSSLSDKSKGLVNNYSHNQALADGRWYFHLKFKNKSGWSPIANYLINIDTIPPEVLSIEEVKLPAETNKARFAMSAFDSLSGVDHFSLQIDQSELQTLNSTTTATTTLVTFDTPNLITGEHSLLVQAVDKAGNIASQQISFTINGPETFWDRLIRNLDIIGPIILLLLILILISVWIWQRTNLLKDRISKGVQRTEENLHKAFDLIHQDLRDQIELLSEAKTKRRLTLVERKIMKTLQTDLAEAEKFIKKDIENIEKQIEK